MYFGVMTLYSQRAKVLGRKDQRNWLWGRINCKSVDFCGWTFLKGCQTPCISSV